MSINYHGLSAEKVAENRKKFGSNVIYFPQKPNLRDKINWVNNTWQIRLLIIVCSIILLLLAMMELFGIRTWNNSWDILLIFTILSVFSYLLFLFNVKWNEDKKCLTISPMISIIVMCFAVVGIIIFSMNTDIQNQRLLPYRWLLIAMFIVLLLSGIMYLLARRRYIIFRRLMHQQDERLVQVIRNGNLVLVQRKDIVVHDVIILQTGDEVPADAYLLDSCNLRVDEHRFTGKKECLKSTDHADYDFTADFPTNYLVGESIIVDGEAIAEVTAVGNHTIAAQLPRQLNFA